VICGTLALCTQGFLTWTCVRQVEEYYVKTILQGAYMIVYVKNLPV